MKYRHFYIAIAVLTVLNLLTLCDNSDLNSNPFADKENKVIGILPFEDFPDRDIDSIKRALKIFFSYDVLVLDKVDLPAMAFTEIRYPRYRADSLLEWISQQQYKKVNYIIGLTREDISITKYADASRTKIKEPQWKYKDFGIFGLGRVGGEVCVVSSNRLSDGVSDETFYRRLTRISCHEIGHVLGLSHCANKNCLMNDANESIKTIDTGNGALCDECRNQIQ